MAMGYRVRTLRGANMVEAHPQKMGSTSDKRWATGRYVKRSLPDRRWEAVMAWTLKMRMEDGSVRVVAFGRSEEEAAEFVAGKGYWATR